MGAVLRWTGAVFCAFALHAGVFLVAAVCGFVSDDAVTLPSLDVTSVELSLSDEPEESSEPATAAPPADALPPLPDRLPPVPSVPPPVALPVESAAVSPAPAPPERIVRNTPVPEPLFVPAQSQARVESVSPPSARESIKPRYPLGAVRRNEEGDVTLDLRISALGIVEAVEVAASCGIAELEAAAVAAAKKALFNPAVKGGKPVSGSTRITLRFRLK